MKIWFKLWIRTLGVSLYSSDSSFCLTGDITKRNIFLVRQTLCFPLPQSTSPACAGLFLLIGNFPCGRGLLWRMYVRDNRNVKSAFDRRENLQTFIETGAAKRMNGRSPWLSRQLARLTYIPTKWP